ncbi:hypothetical protein F5144DRAFT_576145 [Chaetomium tenue]|uniref:Uncharacterized protein n=1 Tax=Chaetomium tenue TaxID=1854479 RepID=A0ACB7P2W1_9PEZI|nr:hypothetical protein F5144DRAFT_576145 [Chaetomium globosum]
MQREMGVRRDPEGKGAGAGVGGVGGSMEGGTVRARARRGSMSVGGDGGGSGVVRPGMRRESPGGFHGRGRGEVTLGAGEADLERKKQQQAAARKQVMDAQKRGRMLMDEGRSGQVEGS